MNRNTEKSTSIIITAVASAAMLFSGWLILSPNPVTAGRTAKCTTECPDGSKLSCQGTKCETKAEKEYAEDPICIVDDEEITRCSDNKKKDGKNKKKDEKKNKKNGNANVGNANAPSANGNVQ